MGSRQGRASAAHDLWRPLRRSRAQRRSLLSERRSSAGLRASRNRTAGPPPPHHELPSIMVGAIHAAAGAARGTLLSAAGDPRAAKRRPRHVAGVLRPAARLSASKTPAVSTLIHANRKDRKRT